MDGKVLAALLLLLGGSITMYILYRMMFGMMEPVVTRKLEQQMTEDEISELKNNLAVHKKMSCQHAGEIIDDKKNNH